MFSDDNNLCLDGFKVIRADHPENIKQGRVCTNYRLTFPVNTIQIKLTYFHITSVSTQTNHFNQNFVLMTRDFNAGSSNLWKNNINSIKNQTSYYGLGQLI